MPAAQKTIEPAFKLSPERQRAALDLLCSQTPPDDREQEIERLVASGPLDGLFVARQGVDLAGAVLGRALAGKVGVVWPPRCRTDASPRLSLELLAAAESYLQQRQTVLAQALVELEGADAAVLQAAGYQRVAELLYLASDAAVFPDAPPAGRVTFEPYTSALQPRLARLVELSYQGTLDCPAVNGLREVADVLEGYRATGVYDPSRWLVARIDDQDVGCLLLTDHPALDQWELIYMGVSPGFRGRGLGTDLVRQGQWLTRQAGRARLVLAVDAANLPALRTYVAAGFWQWGQKAAWVKQLGPARQDRGS